MIYKYHPEIEGLKTNEDGSEVVYNGEVLRQIPINRKSRATDVMLVCFKSKKFSVAKLVCECWNGMAENPRWVATRLEKSKGFHYTNLCFKPRGFNPAMGTEKVKRSKLSNLSKNDVIAIQKRLKKGETLSSIAIDYNTSDTSISRIKEKM